MKIMNNLKHNYEIIFFVNQPFNRKAFKAGKFIPYVFTFMLFTIFSVLTIKSQESTKDYKSLVPQYRFGNTIEEQKAQLNENPLLKRFEESRLKLADDPYRPIYHFVNPEGNLNDPNGLCFWQGLWHLFYQAYPPEDPRQHWGHAVSSDLIHWKDLPLAIYPDPEEKCYSGATFVEDNRVIAIYHGIKQGTMVAVSSDPLLLNWEKIAGKAVIPLPKPGEELPYTVFDPCIWKKGDYYYALTASSPNKEIRKDNTRHEFLHRSKDLVHWEYLHPFLENDKYGLLGDDGACPYFWPIGEDKHILLHFSHMSGGKFIIGDYDTQRNKLIVTQGGDFNHGARGPGGVHAPSAFPDGNGNVVAIFNMNKGKPTVGWNQMMSLPRLLTLRPNGFFNPLHIKPAGNIESLRADSVFIGTMSLPANQEVLLKNISGNAIEIIAEIAPKRNQTIELNVLRSENADEVTRIICMRNSGFSVNKIKASTVTIDATRSSSGEDVQIRPPETAQIELEPDEPFRLRIFIDKSIVEVFVNEKQCLALRVYPDKDDSTGVSLRSIGNDNKLDFLKAWQMKSIYE